MTGKRGSHSTRARVQAQTDPHQGVGGSGGTGEGESPSLFLLLNVPLRFAVLNPDWMFRIDGVLLRDKKF